MFTNFSFLKQIVILCLLTFHVFSFSALAQKRLAITIDDVPNTRQFEEDGFKPSLLQLIDSLGIEVTIFINEGKIYDTDFESDNFQLLYDWVSNKRVRAGNHTFSHPRYSAVELEGFQSNIIKGAAITAELCKKQDKTYQYFRFPYNDLGKDSLQQLRIAKWLKEQNYLLTPFTIESSDWMFNYLYINDLKNGDTLSAKQTAAAYLKHTSANLHFFDSLATAIYQRDIPHIFLCHDNKINADFFSGLLEIFKQSEFEIIDLDVVMQDEIFKQQSHYYGGAGFSWIYRWVESHDLRKEMMQAEPEVQSYFDRYHDLIQKK